VRIDDTGTGNGDGVVQAGEQFKLFYKIKNFGTGAFPGGNVTVTDLDAGFTLISSADTYAAIAALGQSENALGISHDRTEHRGGSSPGCVDRGHEGGARMMIRSELRPRLRRRSW
jgi:hypothetical protein